MSKNPPANPELVMANNLDDSKRIILQAGKALSGSAEKIWPLMEISPIVRSIKGK